MTIDDICRVLTWASIGLLTLDEELKEACMDAVTIIRKYEYYKRKWGVDD